MGLSVVDASVLIAAIDSRDSCHQSAAQELARARQHHDLLLPAVAFSEALVIPYSIGTQQGRAVERQLRALGRVEPITDAIASRAAQIRARRQVKLPDALVLATAAELRANEVLTFDQGWRSLAPNVRVLTR
jgi:predicted nucleic acid-binding protein